MPEMKWYRIDMPSDIKHPRLPHPNYISKGRNPDQAVARLLKRRGANFLYDEILANLYVNDGITELTEANVGKELWRRMFSKSERSADQIENSKQEVLAEA